MRLIPIMEGTKFSILALDTSNDEAIKDCPAEEFIMQMSDSSKKTLTATLNRHKDHGPLWNEEKSRLLWQGIYEFKTRQGDRIYYFYDSGRLTILTHGSVRPKGQQLSDEVSRAVRLKDLYFNSKGE